MPTNTSSLTVLQLTYVSLSRK